MQAFKFGHGNFALNEARAKLAADGRYQLAFMGSELAQDGEHPLHVAHIRLDRLQRVLRQLGTSADFALRRDARIVNVRIDRKTLAWWQRVFFPVWRRLYAHSLRVRGYAVEYVPARGGSVFRLSSDGEEVVRLLR